MRTLIKCLAVKDVNVPRNACMHARAFIAIACLPGKGQEEMRDENDKGSGPFNSSKNARSKKIFPLSLPLDLRAENTVGIMELLFAVMPQALNESSHGKKAQIYFTSLFINSLKCKKK